jgi:hypothetical protein
MRWRDDRALAFAFVLAPRPVKGNSIECPRSIFPARCLAFSQWYSGDGEDIHSEAIPQDLSYLCDVPILCIGGSPL